MANERARQLRRDRTEAERRLWKRLRELKQVGFKFRQQVPIDHFIVDFACLSERLIIEVDGGTHSTDREVARDVRRERYLKDQGFRIVRVWNSNVGQNLEGVMDTIVAALHTPTPDPSPQGGGEILGGKRGELL
jgi:very-short-patch-repair endonuclease